MAARELPAVRSFWERHERLLLDVFLLALESLRRRGDLPTRPVSSSSTRVEDDLSKRLAVELREATFDLGLDHPPKWELPRPPKSDAGLDGPGVGKRPDFTCEVRDIAATSSADAWLYYHIECKCLGEPPSRTWIYNENYVKEGIRRYLDPEYGYGERAPSGAMIGYVLSMTFEKILKEVNAFLGAPSDLGSVPPIRFPSTRSGEIARVAQMLDRGRVVPRRFTLRHLWVDLREESSPAGRRGSIPSAA